MNLQEKRKKSANIAFALDMLHIVVGILIVIFAVLAFLNPDENRILPMAMTAIAGEGEESICGPAE